MIREEAIVTTLLITKAGQRMYFQINLPKDTHRIIGVESGRTLVGSAVADFMSIEADVEGEGEWEWEWTVPFAVIRNKTIGLITLKAPDCGNIFYQDELKEDQNSQNGELVAGHIWVPVPWTYGRKREEVSLSLSPASGFIEGYYKDSGEDGASTLYRFHLYLWIEKCIP